MNRFLPDGLPNGLTETLKRELKLLLLYTLFLFVFFSAFTVFRLLTDGNSGLASWRFGYNFFESLLLAKLILLGQHFHLGERFEDRPLILPTLYKTVVFTIFCFILSVAEEFFIGFLRGKDLATIWGKILESGLQAALGKVLIVFFIFICFFALLEISRVLGEKKLFNLFFRRRS